MTRRASFALLAWLALALPAQAMDDDTAARLATMQQQLDALSQRQDKLDAQSGAGALLKLQSEIDRLKDEIAQLHGMLDVQTHELSVAEKRQTDLYQDLDTRLRALSQNGAAAASQHSSAPAGGAAAGTAVDDTAAAPQSGSAGAGNNPPASAATQQAQAYQAALTRFKQGDYAGAISSFKSFIQTWPDDALAASAQYWIGNAYFSTRDFKSAQAAQQKLIASYPRSPKVPDAMLNLSSAQIELGDMAAARKTLQKLIGKYPGTPAAETGKKRLQMLQGA